MIEEESSPLKKCRLFEVPEFDGFESPEKNVGSGDLAEDWEPCAINQRRTTSGTTATLATSVSHMSTCLLEKLVDNLTCSRIPLLRSIRSGVSRQTSGMSASLDRRAGQRRTNS